MRRLRARVVEEAYGVVAEVKEEEADEPRSDRIAAAIRISQELRARGRNSSLEEESGAVSVRIVLGDAPEEEFEDAAYDLLEAASW